MEYAEDIQLADQVIEHPMVKRLEDACNDWILIQNDILSYQKEVSHAGPSSH